MIKAIMLDVDGTLVSFETHKEWSRLCFAGWHRDKKAPYSER